MLTLKELEKEKNKALRSYLSLHYSNSEEDYYKLLSFVMWETKTEEGYRCFLKSINKEIERLKDELKEIYKTHLLESKFTTILDCSYDLDGYDKAVFLENPLSSIRISMDNKDQTTGFTRFYIIKLLKETKDKQTYEIGLEILKKIDLEDKRKEVLIRRIKEERKRSF